MSAYLKDLSFLNMAFNSGIVMTVVTSMIVGADNIFRDSPVQLFSYSFD